jgi:hypothetical protein
MVHIYLPQKIHQQLEAYEQRTGKTHADVVLDAVEATYATLLVPGRSRRCRPAHCSPGPARNMPAASTETSSSSASGSCKVISPK